MFQAIVTKNILEIFEKLLIFWFYVSVWLNVGEYSLELQILICHFKI